ncbi:MAG: VOC family protein [Gaiellaceae bacterium]
MAEGALHRARPRARPALARASRRQLSATFYPGFRYPDADAAIAWLADAFGFEPGGIHRDDAGRVRHAELWLDGAAIMLGEGEASGGGAYVAVDDIDALYERASSAGAEIERPLGETSYGSREFAARDLAGLTWYFGTYRPTRE